MTLEGAQGKVIVCGKISNPFVISRGVKAGRWFVCNIVHPCSPRSTEKPGTKQYDFEQTDICGYADDILVIARGLPALEAMCAEISREAGRVGLVINPDKTKYMRFSASPSRRSVKGATINGVTYEGVAEFIYLGTLISNDNSVEKEIQRRI